ncbi:MAG: MobF family relaxase [Pseudomonadota bacterium]
MVATISALSSAGQAASYYEADDYYAGDDDSPSAWSGHGAEALGLFGSVDRDLFKQLLEGHLPNGQKFGTLRGDGVAHRPGWDITLSAPKSVSLMAEVAGDKRLFIAHSDAVKAGLSFAETHANFTRIRSADGIKQERTQGLAIATFRHDTSRAQDPQLHTHAVILNAAQDQSGKWRSLEPRALYQMQKQIGATYRQALAVNVRKLGYEIETAKDSTFEIKGVPQKTMKAFSVRASQIEARLAERGKTRETASAEEKQIAALDTRDRKTQVDRCALLQDWQKTATAAEFDSEAQSHLVQSAKGRAAVRDHQPTLSSHGELAAYQSVAQAIESLAERNAVFAATDLQIEAGHRALGYATQNQIQNEIAKVLQRGAILSRTHLDRRGVESAGFTTPKQLAYEQKLLNFEAIGRSKVAPVLTRKKSAREIAKAAHIAEQSGFSWMKDQRVSATQLLTSRNSITALQGYAGTAKTTTVLSLYAQSAREAGLQVVPMAPTASAAQTLGNALGAKATTIARHFINQTRADRSSKNAASVWIVDEASMLSARDTARLFQIAHTSGARLVLVGDVKQLGSIEAGAAFKQLQDAGMQTAKLAQIVRQNNAHTLQAVEAAVEGDAKKALAALDSGGGNIIEIENRDARFQKMAKDYANLTSKQRDTTLVLEPSRAGRDALNAEIRHALKSRGELSGQPLNATSLVAKGLTRSEAKDVRNYAVDDVVQFMKSYAAKGVDKSISYEVASIDAKKNALTLRSQNGRAIPWHPRQWGAAASQAYESRAIGLQAGDRIMFTKNDPAWGRHNGTRAQVISVNDQRRAAVIKLETGETQTLSLDKTSDQHLRHAYVDTIHAAQGRTANRVMISSSSRQTNLVDQKSFYVAISRAKLEVSIYTNDRAGLIRTISERAGEKQTALQQSSAMDANSISAGGKSSKQSQAGLGS